MIVSTCTCTCFTVIYIYRMNVYEEILDSSMLNVYCRLYSVWWDAQMHLKPLSHQGGVLTVIPRRPKKMQNAEVRAVRTQASPQQRSGITIGRGGIA